MQGIWMLDRGVGAACGSDKVGSSCSCPRRGAGVVVWWGAGFTEESVGRRPPCYRLYGKDIHALKGKTTRTMPKPVVIDDVVMPKNILENNKNITFSIDIMFVNKKKFVTTISRHIKFTTVEVIQKRTKSQLSECIKNAVAIYTQRGFNVKNALLDGEFMPLRTNLLNMGIYANSATQNEYVQEIERQHHVIKERARACRSNLLFEVLPWLLLVEMVNNCALWINMFPAKGDISNVSPRTLMTGIKLDYSIPLQKRLQV